MRHSKLSFDYHEGESLIGYIFYLATSRRLGLLHVVLVAISWQTDGFV